MLKSLYDMVDGLEMFVYEWKSAKVTEMNTCGTNWSWKGCKLVKIYNWHLKQYDNT